MLGYTNLLLFAFLDINVFNVISTIHSQDNIPIYVQVRVATLIENDVVKFVGPIICADR